MEGGQVGREEQGREMLVTVFTAEFVSAKLAEAITRPSLFLSFKRLETI